MLGSGDLLPSALRSRWLLRKASSTWLTANHNSNLRMINRRTLIGTAALTLCGATATVRGQVPRPRRIGFLANGTPEAAKPQREAFCKLSASSDGLKVQTPWLSIVGHKVIPIDCRDLLPNSCRQTSK